MSILEDLVPKGLEPVCCDAIIVDGAALVHFLSPKETSTFSGYTNLQLFPHLRKQAEKLKATRLDLVWDLYFADSTKEATREGRGDGVRRRDLPAKGEPSFRCFADPGLSLVKLITIFSFVDKLPPKWEDYLKNSENKEELFKFLAKEFLTFDENLQKVTNEGSLIKATTHESSLKDVTCGKMEEADGRIIWHVRDAVIHGAKSVLIRATDTDVLVLAVSNFFSLQAQGLKELWVLTGKAKKKQKGRRFIPAHYIAIALGEDRAAALRGFHAFSGCDQVSFFASKLKRTHWKTWLAFPQATEAFKFLGEVHDAIAEHVQRLLEEYVVHLFATERQLLEMGAPLTLNKLRRFLFEAEHKLHLLPPTLAALIQHILRAAYQAGQIWGRVSVNFDSEVPSAEGWGWTKTTTGSWTPHWTDLSWIWEACRCGCQKTPCDSKRCMCVRNDLPCTPACKCHGKCKNTEYVLPLRIYTVLKALNFKIKN